MMMLVDLHKLCMYYSIDIGVCKRNNICMTCDMYVYSSGLYRRQRLVDTVMSAVYVGEAT